MRRLVRLTVFWLLAAALPLQGVAAATMRSCAPVGHHGNAMPASPHGHDAGLAIVAPAATDAVATIHRHAGDASHAGHANQAGHASHASMDHGDDSNARSDAGGAVAKCSACSFCCTGAAAPAHLLVFGPLDLPEFYAPFAARSVAAFVSEGLERPPRTVLA